MNPQKTIITDIPGKPGRFWGDNTKYIGPYKAPKWLKCIAGHFLATNLTGLITATRLMLNRHRCKGIVTDGGFSGLYLALFQRLFPSNHRPHIMIDCLWYKNPTNWKHLIKSLLLNTAASSVHRFVVWASHEVNDYSSAFGIPVNKFEYIPFHITLTDHHYIIRDEGYIFAGGNYDRDYHLLINAVRDMNIPTWIATTRCEQLLGINLPEFVRVEGTSPTGFRQAIASARVVIIPMKDGLLHSGGQQTCLNAMHMGKPTIAVGRKWAKDLILDGETGIIVDYGDEVALRRAIQWIWDNPSAARRMGHNAARFAATMTTDRTMKNVYALVSQAGICKLITDVSSSTQCTPLSSVAM